MSCRKPGVRNRSPCLLILTALTGLVGCRTIDRTLQEAHIPCGVYRWQVKILTDPDAEGVRLEPIGTTVREVVEFSPPPPDFDRKHRSGNEFYVYRLTAQLIAVHARLDQDLHLFLRDPDDPERRMIAEIPNPKCTKNSRHEPEFAAARLVAESVRSRGGKALVEVVGVGFFDEYHESKGGAPNGFELHPVLKLTEIVPAGR